MIDSRKSGDSRSYQSKPGTVPNSKKYVSGDDEEEYEEEFEEADQKPTYDNWLNWTQEQAEEMSKSDDIEA